MTYIVALIPCFNAERFIATAIDSVLAQTRPVARVVVVDDGSTDGSVGIVEGYAARGLPVSCIRTPVNGGPGTARNIGVRATDEPLIAFLDADDVWEPTHCATLGALLDQHPEAVLALSQARTMGGDAPGPELRLPPGEPVDAAWPLVYDNVATQSAVMVRRAAFLAGGGYLDGMRHAEDYDLWLRLAELGPFVASAEVTCRRRLHEGQATLQASRMYQGAWAARRRMRERRVGALSPAERARLDAMLAAAFERDLRWAWQSRSRALVREVLALAPDLPCLHAVERRWRRRLRFFWPLWRLAAALWDAVPASVRNLLRRLRRARAAAMPAAAVIRAGGLR